MGAAMATRLCRAGIAVTVYNRSIERAAAFSRLGATIATTPRVCAEASEVVITMVSDASALMSVAKGPDGLVAGLRKHTRWVDMSTVGRAAALEANQMARAEGARFADAPVSGTTGPAERGELIAFLGARVGDLPKVEPILSVLCKRFLHVGDVGQGQAMKVVLNTLGTHHFVAFASMLALGERAGLSRETIVEAFTTGAFASPSYLGKKSKVLVRDYSPEFTLALALKDAKLGEDLGRETGMDLPVVRDLVREIETGIRAGLGDEDLFALEKVYPR
jgi:3-hydroxyisobutyrate dehydrogenase-like beta-hydroxyacid dehydrogenase